MAHFSDRFFSANKMIIAAAVVYASATTFAHAYSMDAYAKDPNEVEAMAKLNGHRTIVRTNPDLAKALLENSITHSPRVTEAQSKVVQVCHQGMSIQNEIDETNRKAVAEMKDRKLADEFAEELKKGKEKGGVSQKDMCGLVKMQYVKTIFEEIQSHLPPGITNDEATSRYPLEMELMDDTAEVMGSGSGGDISDWKWIPRMD